MGESHSGDFSDISMGMGMSDDAEQHSEQPEERRPTPPPPPPPPPADHDGAEMTMIGPLDQVPPPTAYRPQGPLQGTPPQAYQAQGYPQAGTPAQGYQPQGPQVGTPAQGYQPQGPQVGTPAQGYQPQGPQVGTPGAGYQSYGSPQGTPSGGRPSSGTDLTLLTSVSQGAPDATIPAPLQGSLSDRTIQADLAGSDGPNAPTMATVGAASAPSQIMNVDNLIGAQLGDYRLDKKIGQGGMGAVFLGIQVSLDRPCAIKVLPAHLSADASFIERFQLGARACAKLQSPHIIQVYGAGAHNGIHFFAMEYVQGDDLNARMKQGLRPTPAEALDLVLQAARGLAAAGEQGLVHRDIKPHNMMVTDDGKLKIMDFGLVKMSDDSKALTMTGAVMGTVSYFSPEQGRGERCDCRTDLYALGVVFYELLSGSLPFTGNDATSVIYQHIHSAPRPLREINPEVPESMQAVVLKCMQKQRDDRYQDAQQLIEDLESIRAGGQPGHALENPELLLKGASASAGFARDRHSRSMVPLLIGLGIVVVLGVGYVLFTKAESRQQAPVSGPPRSPGDPAAAALTRARHALEQGDLQRAEILVEQGLADGGAAWEELAEQLRTSRRRILVGDFRQALGAGDFDKAEQLMAQLANLGADDARLREEFDQARVRRDSLAQVRSLLDAGKAAAAVVRCDELLDAGGRNSSELQNMRQQATDMKELHENADRALAEGNSDTAGDLYAQSLKQRPNELARRGLQAVAARNAFGAAFQRRDLDEARRQQAALLTLMGESRSASHLADMVGWLERYQEIGALLAADDFTQAEAVLSSLRADQADAALIAELDRQRREQQALAELDRHIAAGNLLAAQAQVQAIAALAPDGDILAEARRRLTASRLAEQREQAAAAAAEAEIQAAFTALREQITEQELAPEDAEQALAALIASHGSQRPEIVGLHALIADRRSARAAQDLLAELDRRVLAGGTAWQALVRAEKLRQAIDTLQQQSGLIFAHTLHASRREGERVFVEASLRQGFDAYPAATIAVTYGIERVDDAWIIISFDLVSNK